MRSRWRIAPPSPLAPDHQTTGATRAEGRGRRTRRGKRSAHGRRPGGRPQRQRRRQGARPARNRLWPTAKGRGRLCPCPRLKFRLGATPKGEHDEGKGGVPCGRGGGRGTTRRETERSALPHATPGASASSQASGRRRAAAAPDGRKGHAPARHADARESAASGQAAQTDGAEAASGRGSCHTFTPRPSTGATTPTDGGAAAKAGGDGAGRAALGRDCWPPTPCHQRRKKATQGRASRERGRRGGQRTTAGADSTLARIAELQGAPAAVHGQSGGAPTAHRW